METSRLHAFVCITDASTSTIQQPNVLEKICGQEAILYTTKLFDNLGISTTLIIDESLYTPHFDTVIKHYHGDAIKIILQTKEINLAQVLLDSDANNQKTSSLLIVQGIMPLLPEQLIKNLYAQHISTHAAISYINAHNEDINSLLEEQSPDHNAQNDRSEINSSIFLIERLFLEKYLCVDQNNNNKTLSCFFLAQEAQNQHKTVTRIAIAYDEVRSIATFKDLWAVEHIKRSELITHWMNKGVRFAAPHTVHIDMTVTIGVGSYIGAGVHLYGTTAIGRTCQIHAFSILNQVELGDNSIIYSHCVIKKSIVGTSTQIGPFAHLNGDITIDNHVTVGNFVEMKRSKLGKETKIKHLAYLGDAQVGNQVNIGAGTITCNHDGFTKHTTLIEDNAYIGTNTTLIAPLTIEHDAFIAAGSTITKDVPSYALALARTRQTNKQEYVHILREKKQKETTQNYSPPSPDENQPTAFIGAVKPSPKTTPSNI